jgi:predicted amidophosphoribosyltransferase
MECTGCKTEIESDSKFCPKCGIEIERETPSIAQIVLDAGKCWFAIGAFYALPETKVKEKITKNMIAGFREIGQYDNYVKILETFKDTWVSDLLDKEKATESTP